jgi:hypothetical protein
MNVNKFAIASRTGKLAAVCIAFLMAFSGVSTLAAGGQDDVNEASVPTLPGGGTITFGDGSVPTGEDAALLDMVAMVDSPQIAVTMAEGKFSPEASEPGDAKVLIVDDDMSRRTSGPWLEASHIAPALNDAGYSFDVFRAGYWNGAYSNLPSGDKGLALLNNYEAIIWYDGYIIENSIMTSGEQSQMKAYLDGDCTDYDDDAFCTDNRNVIQMSQYANRLFYEASDYSTNYLHFAGFGAIIVDGCSNPMKGVEDSIFDNKEYSTETCGVHYLNKPVAIRPDSSGSGAFWFDMEKDSTAPYHAIQFPRSDVPYTGSQDHKAFFFSEDIGVFDSRSERADFFATILDWMEVDREARQNVDIGIGGLEIPNHSQYWRTIEAMVPVEIKVTVTNYGYLPQSATGVRLQLKNEFLQTLFDNTFDSSAFPAGHPMHFETLMPGESVVFTFNRTNDAYQQVYDGKDPNKARHVLFTSAGMDFVRVWVVHAGDQGASNNYVQGDVGVSKWVDNGELNEPGASITIGDTDDNGANSLDRINYHRNHDFDHDADGCWGVDCEPRTSAGYSGGTANQSYRYAVHEKQLAFAPFTPRGWYKTNANPANCDWDTMTDSDCPKFTPEPYQDDYFVSPPVDLSAMEEVVVGMVFTGCQESGDYARMQVSDDGGNSWTNLISMSGFCPGAGAWYLWGGGNSKYQGYTLPSSYYGDEENSAILWRYQQDSDSDQVTENNNRVLHGLFIDEIVFRGTEKITRDVAVTDITVRKEAFRAGQHQNDANDRQINATILNAGEAPWTNLAVKFTVTNLQQTEDFSDLLTEQQPEIPTLAGNSKYGNVDTEGHEDDDKLFVVFPTPVANTYFIEVEALVPAGRDFFPWNNSMKVMFRVYDTFFFDNVDDHDYTYSQFHRLSGEANRFYDMDVSDDSTGSLGNAKSGQWVWRYFQSETDSYASGADDGMVTPDTCDRDGSGDRFSTDVCIDLRAAYAPKLQYSVKWDLANGDRLEVRAARDFDSSQKITSGAWTVLRTYEGTSGTWSASDWIDEDLNLSAFEGFQTWIDFRVVSNVGGGRGVLLDDIMVIGSEYRNNIAITDVATDRFAAAGKDHDLSITVKSIGLEPQQDVAVYARITDMNGVTVWPDPADRLWNLFQLQTALNKGDSFTVDPTSAGSAWRWGAELAPGIYNLHVRAERPDQLTVPDEHTADNTVKQTLVLGAALLSSAEWSSDDWNMGSWVWDGSDSGTLTSQSFNVWNSKPFLVVEAAYELDTASVQAQVRAGSSNQWFDVKWREAGETTSLYAIPDANYTSLPDSWTGSSYFDKRSSQTFYADLGVVDEISDGSGLQDQYVGGPMQVRLVGTSGGGSGNFTAYTTAVFGLNSYDMDVKEITPTSQKGAPSSSTGDIIKRTYTVKARNLGAVSDSAVVDFTITAPDNSFVTLESGSYCQGCPGAILSHIMQQGRETVVAIKPIPGFWGGNRDDPAGGDPTAYIDKDGVISWPSGTSDYTMPTGWSISNPTKSTSWDAGKPMEPSASNFMDPGDSLNVNVEVTVGFAAWAPPGTYTIQSDVRSWTDYDDTFTEGDADGQATMAIDKPDLMLGDYSYVSHAVGYSVAGTGWSKRSGGDEYFTFRVEVRNAGTETVGSFKVGLLDFSQNPLGVQVSISWTGTNWVVDSDGTSATGAEIQTSKCGNDPSRTCKYVYFKATATELGMSAGPGDDVSGVYTFYLAVDTEDIIDESDEGNNRVAIDITTVSEINTVPSFSMALWSTMLGGLLAALGVAFRRREEEE